MKHALWLACIVLSGCASQALGPHQPSLDNIQLLRQAGVPTMSVGEFRLAPAIKPALDKSVSVRGSTISSPNNGSFALYLREALIVDLQAAGKYDQAAPTSVGGRLLENELNAAGISKADATLAARFTVTRQGAVLYEKPLREVQTWESSFVGVIAIPEAVNRYTDLYTRLLKQLFSDADFKAAVATTDLARAGTPVGAGGGER